MSLGLLVWYGARICLVAMFPFSAVDKLWHWRNSLKQTESSGLPGGTTMLVAAILIETITPLMIVLAWHDRFGAFLLASFCVGLAGGLGLVVFAGPLAPPKQVIAHPFEASPTA
jgi:putative oxidoreductase